ncbi:CIC11C00000000190 [Sungouiella intermedia]|uniref:CIC11C00000000190 n=1 Tax=Sungouiella intermedia TaxID=45354 RepID=A0A1L0DWW5_9ASCO|nr:CIC11C00000000190 [[Candida] intermedia]
MMILPTVLLMNFNPTPLCRTVDKPLMIRGNYSLAKEVRQNELKQRQKIQQRQKHQHRLQKLQLQDPIRLYFQIQKLEASQPDTDQQTRLKRLKEDWKFIEKNKLHDEKLRPFLEEQKRKQEAKRKAESKLWGKQSIYFNPELNPLGKVPDVHNILYEISGTLSNLTLPIKSRKKYEKDPLLESLQVTIPEGPRPQFYKQVQNTKIQKKTNMIDPKEEKEENHALEPQPKRKFKKTNLDSDSDADIHSEEEWDSKRQRF